jgi:hypothetical protein
VREVFERSFGRCAAAAAAMACAALLAPASASGEVRAGASVVDATWHVGASAGQYASDCSDERNRQEGECNFASVHGADPHFHTTRRAPSYGVQSRLTVRALVVQGEDGRRVAVLKNDLYIPQDLLFRRAAQILEAGGSGIGRANLTMAVSHNHSSPYYSGTSWGVWAFQDVFDFRFYEYYARRMALAVERAASNLVPVRVGASVSYHDFPQRNAPGPQIADDGTPAGFPRNYTDHDLIVIRFDDISNPRRPRPLANLVNYGLHPEFLNGNDLISADYLGPLERMADRATGAVTIWTQSAVGNTEPENNEWHDLHDRAFFSHREYAQAEFAARGMANTIIDTWRDIERGTPEDGERFVPFRSSFEVGMVDRWFPGPASHPYPGVSSCRTDSALAGDPRAPVIGLPDCTGPGSTLSQHPNNPGITTDMVQQFGIPVPENYSAPSYTGLEEDVSVHLQALRLGDILLTVCACEQWADQSLNIKSRTNERRGDEHRGYNWFDRCTQRPDGNWTCPDPRNPSATIPSGNDCPNGSSAPRCITDLEFRRMRAQVINPANGWDDLSYVPFAESEPVNPDDIKGNYTHQEIQEIAGANPYRLTVPISMANDYNGYIVTYREYQRGDHYRKALTAWGPHSSDYMATRLVRMGAHLNGGPDVSTDEWPGGQQKVDADLGFNDVRARGIGEFAARSIPAYESSLPNDGGEAEITRQPQDVERFGAAFLTWNGGSNYTDDPTVRVERRVGRDWEEYADQSGEVPVTLRLPPAQEVPAYRQGNQRWLWTAHFEAFVAPFDTGERPRATPPGLYRFVVSGQRREGGRVVHYRLASRAFGVRPWDDVKVENLRRDADGTVSFRVGPRTQYDTKAANCGGPQVTGELGPIDYPDSYESPARFIRHQRQAFVRCDDPSQLEWFCFTCSFRPWIDTGDASRAVVTFVRANRRVDRVHAEQGDDGRWHTARQLGRNEAAYVESGDVCDRFGNYNGAPTATIGDRGTTPDKPPTGFSCLPSATRELLASLGLGPGLGLPPTSSCLDRRRFRFRIHQPRGGRVIAVNVFVNGRRVLSRRGRRITVIRIRPLPRRGTYRVKIVAITNTGLRVTSVRTYRGCKKGRPRTTVRRPGRRR